MKSQTIAPSLIVSMLFLVLLIAFCFVPMIAAREEVQSKQDRGTAEQMSSAIAEAIRTSARSSGPAPTLSARERSREQWKRLPRTFWAPALASAGSVTGTVWTPIGPDPIVEDGCCGSPFTFAANGRVNSIAVDPTNTDRIYLGSAGGGVWKSENGGTSWKPLTDQQISLGIGASHAMAIDPKNPKTIYAGTSSFAMLDQSLLEPHPNDLAQSRGILKSTDGGESWIQLGSGVPTGNDGNAASLFFGVNINTIIVDPADSDVVYLAAGRGNDPNYGGFFWSHDGGHNWAQGKGTEKMMVESLALDESSPFGSRVLYAGVWTKGVLKSTDGGQNWSPVLTASTPTVASALGPAGILKTIVALAPVATSPNPAGPVIYVSVMPTGKNPPALIFENTNGGTESDWSWRKAHVSTYLNLDLSNLYGLGFTDMVVDPASPGDGKKDLLYWGGLSQYLSTDSGENFDEIGQIHGTHGDHQTWLIVPRAGTSSTVYAGDDGGIWKSENQGGDWTGTSKTGSPGAGINAGGLQIATLYQLAVQQDSTASATLGGAQDSGALRTPPPLPDIPPTWSGTSNDGIDVVFDKINTDIAYCIQNNSFFKSTDGGAAWPTNFTPNIPPAQIDIFRNRLAIDPNNSGYLYVGGAGSDTPPTLADVLQTTDGTATFRSLGLPLNLPPGQVKPPAWITSLDVAPGNSEHLVVSSGNQVFVSTNVLAGTVGPPSGVVFQNITGNLPGPFVTRVAFDPNDPTVVYATLAGFGTGHIFRKSITAQDWTDISPPVDLPVNAIALDGSAMPAVVYLGTDLGVLRSDDGGTSWAVVDDLHLPNAAVSDLDINANAGVLRAATWGRGVFELAAPTGPAVSVVPTQLDFGETCAVTGGTQTIDVSNVGAAPLTISSVQRLNGSSHFTVLPNPLTPAAISPGSDAVFTVQFVPTAAAPEAAFIRISSDDPTVPFVDVLARGTLEKTPPTISSLTATPALLWPPDHKMRETSLQVDVSDNCDPAVAQSCHIISVTSSEPVLGDGDGNTSPDWEITGSLTANLRAERSGNGSGRTYTLTVRCTDSAGNSSDRSVTVLVPLNQAP